MTGEESLDTGTSVTLGKISNQSDFSREGNEATASTGAGPGLESATVALVGATNDMCNHLGSMRAIVAIGNAISDIYNHLGSMRATVAIGNAISDIYNNHGNMTDIVVIGTTNNRYSFGNKPGNGNSPSSAN